VYHAFGAELWAGWAQQSLTFCDATFVQEVFVSLEPLLAPCHRWT
jgi:hypothetical protein